MANKSTTSICKVTIGGGAASGGGGGTTYYFKGSTSYQVPEIATATGVSVVKPEDWTNGEPIIPIAALILAGKVERLTASITTNTTPPQTRYVDLIVAKDKVTTIEVGNSIQGKDYKVADAKKGTFDNNARQKRTRVKKRG
jgi:hypothetical protein